MSELCLGVDTALCVRVHRAWVCGCPRARRRGALCVPLACDCAGGDSAGPAQCTARRGTLSRASVSVCVGRRWDAIGRPVWESGGDLWSAVAGGLGYTLRCLWRMCGCL